MKIIYNGITFENSPHILHDNTVGLGTPPVTSIFEKTYDQDGETYLRNNYEKRIIDFMFTLIGTDNTDLNTKKNALYSALNAKNGLKEMTLTLNQTLYINALSNGIQPLANEGRGDYWQTYQASFTCPDPFFTTTEATQLMTPFTGGFSFPFSFPFSLGTPAATATITITGDTETPIRIVLVGPLVQPKVTNTTTGEFISITTNIASGETVTIDTKLKTITSDVNGNVFHWLDTDSTFWYLEPGANVVTYITSTSILGSSCTIYYRNRYTGI
jgi:phage-related protein